jgi:general secretion pathway protein G
VRDRARQRALTLVELLLAIAILGVLSTLAYAGYQQYFEKARIAQAKVDIRGMEASLERYHVSNARFPETLAEAGLAGKLDPWQRPYQYLNVATAKKGDKVRKDHKLHPINTDYDLYSMGKDGQSNAPLTAKPSRDDVIRANNGAFLGLASDY